MADNIKETDNKSDSSKKPSRTKHFLITMTMAPRKAGRQIKAGSLWNSNPSGRVATMICGE